LNINKKIMLRVCFIGILVLMLLNNESFASPSGSSDDKSGDAYKYPVLPGTPDWKALNTQAEKLKVCQVPVELLRQMSTEGLVQTVLDYPLLGNMTGWNSLQEGFEKIAAGFNGISELFSRKDAGHMLLTRYRTMDPAAIDPEWKPVQKGAYAWKFIVIEMLLAQRAILVNMTADERRDLLDQAKIKSQVKRKYSFYDALSQESMANLLNSVSSLAPKD
jgi:hypothetical protein